ncbi:MAG: class I SAM-dependent methyltransferase [Clostridiales bacterium]
MKLSRRLNMIVNCIEKTNLVVDIGTDHAFIPIEALRRNLTKKAIASDIKEGPLKIAKNNIDKYNLAKFIETRMSNGLANILEKELKTVVITGMGGFLITEILKNSLEKSKNIDELILQPMNSSEYMRKWLYRNGFNIRDEILVKEDKRVYCVLNVKYDGQKREVDNLFYYIGKRLFENNDNLLDDYMNRIRDINIKKMKSLEKSKNSGIKYEEVLKLVNDIEKIINKSTF